jgi:hypothetical protein
MAITSGNVLTQQQQTAYSQRLIRVCRFVAGTILLGVAAIATGLVQVRSFSSYASLVQPSL